jgi:hypothetical protein
LVDYKNQIQRIKTKLEAARKADKKLEVFGAKSHRYRIGRPASEREVCEFEERYSLVLPGCYRAFVTAVGNGGPSYRGSAAGPFYGIYPLGEFVDEILDNPALFLNRPAIIEPDMTDEEWSTITGRINDDETISGEEYDEELGKIYAGLLPIGSQGCSYLHALVLNGPYEGRVVNLDLDQQKPRFAFERNFLDWYERWLDEVICGYLMQDRPTWFGYTMGGDDEHLMRVYAHADGRKTRLEALMGLAKLIAATEESCRKLLDLCGEQDVEIRHQALGMLTKFAYPMAREPLRTHLVGADDDCLAACQSIFWYARKQSKEWVDLLRSRLPMINTPETFRFLSYLLADSGVDFSEDFRPLCMHEHEDIRVIAFYSLGKLKNKRALVDLFVVGLDDASPRVVHTVLQALEGVRDRRLLRAYTRLLDRFRTDEHYVLTNLEHRLRDMGFHSIEEFRMRSAK